MGCVYIIYIFYQLFISNSEDRYLQDSFKDYLAV